MILKGLCPLNSYYPGTITCENNSNVGMVMLTCAFLRESASPSAFSSADLQENSRWQTF